MPRLCLAAPALALLAGCASFNQLPRTPLADEHRKAIVSSTAIGNLARPDVGTSIDRSRFAATALNGGLLVAFAAALVDSAVEGSRAKAAESGAAPIREVLAGYDPGAALQAALEKELAGSATLHGARVELRREAQLDAPTVKAMISRAGTDALLVVDLEYHFSPEFDFLVVSSVASLYPTPAATAPVLRKLSSVSSGSPSLASPLLYREILLSSLAAPPGPDGAGRWLGDGGAAVRLGIEGGIAEVARMLAWDLEQGGPTGHRYHVPNVLSKRLRHLGDAQWLLLRTDQGRSWYRAMTGELASVGDAYPGVALLPAKARATAARAASPATAPATAAAAPVPAPAPAPTAAPAVEGGGKLTFEIAGPDRVRDGGEIEIVRYSQVDGDVALEGAALADGALTVKGQLGFGRGSYFAGLGPRFFLRPGNAPMDATPFRAVTIRVAASTLELRIGAVGTDVQARNTGCYPVYTLQVSDRMQEYTIPLARFAPEGYCKVESVKQTLSHLVGFDVVSTRVSQRPLRLTVGAITLER